MVWVVSRPKLPSTCSCHLLHTAPLVPLAPLVHWSTLVHWCHPGPKSYFQLHPVPLGPFLFHLNIPILAKFRVESKLKHFKKFRWTFKLSAQKILSSPTQCNVVFIFVSHCGLSCKHLSLWKNALQRLACHVGFRWDSAFLIYVHLSRWEMAMHLSSPHIQLDRAAINTHCLNIWSRFYVCSSRNKK